MSFSHLRRHIGFTLIEVMVGLAIGMIAALVMTQVFAISESQKRTTTTGSDAQTNGSIGIYTIERDVRIAGYGFNAVGALGCTINANYDGDDTTFQLTPITITQGVGGLPDSITVMYSSKSTFSAPARIITNHPPQATNMFLNTTLGMEENDLVVAFETGKDCTLLQITGIPNGNVQIHHQNTSPWNPPGGQNIFPKPDGYRAGASLFNLGGLVRKTYSIDANSNLVLGDFRSATNTVDVQVLAPSIVNLQAQYGIDMNGVDDGIVDTWSDVIPPGAALNRVYAIRLALVARSGLVEKATGGSCDITTANSNNRPMWLNNVDIDVSRHPNGAAYPLWQCHRYKVFEAIMPLRNQIWRVS
ncbi:PilW family protein [Noviherbaspirillum sp.]|uniref:PilW family protein n=1 Tax=Noviherbaspirillum sp. TaxID=1926288 RepID=UPI002FE323CB